ncbi:hypothetical protein EBAPG3_002010 [Nitrosospira lacus]|uniref:RiboL-PSP-HEPN domain-containing protein n=1 Tax=Nitrosospira lacus TaxID=1288494 RepID=A0A1W6SLH6_9PROT|nr:hypothetical protein [Nitrosospira lacus]ARO86649.1 hypothetical protein EBAPG3_002010 [Nitrosospira lacus]
MYYSIHLAGSYVLKEFFLASNYRECIAASERKITEVGKWAVEMRSQGYHELHTHAFVGMWAAFEAGIEDTVASVIQNDRAAATAAVSKFKKDRYSIHAWPWTRSVCIEIAQKLDQKSKDAVINGGIDLFGRIRNTFSWVDVSVEDDLIVSSGLAEASRMRNIIVHRYGQIEGDDAIAVPALTPWIGKVMPIDPAKFDSYYKAIAGCLVALMTAMSKSRYGGT